MKRALFLAFIFLAGCRSDDLGKEKTTVIDVNVAAPTWNNGIADLLLYKCDSCHNTIQGLFVPGNARGLKFDLSANEGRFLANYAARTRARVFESQELPMPPDFATQFSEDEKAALLAYLNRRAPAAP